MDREPEFLSGRLVSRVLIPVFLYGAIWMLHYSGTPLGLDPVLDGAETLELAKAMASGTLPAEPFYRAPGYAAILAIGYAVGIPDFWMPMVARFFNLGCHLVTTLLVMRVTARLWGDSLPRGGVPVAGLVYGFYPVALFFAADPLDMTLAITLGIAAADQWIRGRDTRSLGSEIRGGLWLGLACLVRPHFLILLPLMVLRWGLSKGNRLQVGAGMLVVAGCIVAMGWVNLRVGGEFRPTPWQGSFNLWAANRAGSTGAWLTQRYELRPGVEVTNPARAEGEWAYRTATGAIGPVDIGEMNAWFKKQFRDELRADPVAWAELMVRKFGILLYQVEQYNNKTYSFHAEREPLLGWNPIGWGWVLVLAGIGLASGRIPRGVWQLLAGMGVFAAGVLIFFVSARFRLPLVAPLVVIAAGSFRWVGPDRDGLRAVPAIAVAAILGLLTFVDWGGFDQSERTSLEDRLLLASASLRTGDPGAALEAVEPVLAALPERQSALRLAMVSRFELDLMEPEAVTVTAARELMQWYRRLQRPEPQLSVLAAVYAIRLGDSSTAMEWIEDATEAGTNVERADALGLMALRGSMTEREATDLAALVTDLKGGRFAFAAGWRAGWVPVEIAASHVGMTTGDFVQWVRQLERLLGT